MPELQKYRFEYRENKTVIEVDPWDVPEMVKNAHDWRCLDDVSALLVGKAMADLDKSKTLHLKK